MRVLAIDPGPSKSAFVVWDGALIWDKGIRTNDEIITEDIQIIKADLLVIEKVMCYGQAVGQSVLDTCYWTGRFIEQWRLIHKQFYDRIPRMAVKMHLCHTSRAKDGNVRQAVIDRLGEPGTKHSPGATYGVSKDVWQALALAIYAVDEIVEGGGDQVAR
jgi:hypothetical protein